MTPCPRPGPPSAFLFSPPKPRSSSGWEAADSRGGLGVLKLPCLMIRARDDLTVTRALEHRRYRLWVHSAPAQPPTGRGMPRTRSVWDGISLVNLQASLHEDAGVCGRGCSSLSPPLSSWMPDLSSGDEVCGVSTPRTLRWGMREASHTPRAGGPSTNLARHNQPFTILVFLGAPPLREPTRRLRLGYSWASLGPLHKHWPARPPAVSSHGEPAWSCCWMRGRGSCR